MKHYSEAEMLEFYYLPAEGSGRDHLVECGECSRRFERLSGRLHQAAEQHDAKIEAYPESFWERQRAAVRREVRGKEIRPVGGSSFRMMSIAAAVIAAFLTGAIFYYRGTRPDAPVKVLPQQAVAEIATAAQTEPLEVSEAAADPWESEALSGYEEIVEWESWVTPAVRSGGTL